MTARDLVDKARDFHPAFHRNNIGNVMALRALSAAERHLYREVTKLAEEALSTPVDIDVADIIATLDDRTGVEVPACITLLDGTYKLTTDTVRRPLELITYANRTSPPCFPSAWTTTERFFPMDKRDFGYSEHGWEDIELVTLNLVPLPPALTSFTTTVDEETTDTELLAPDVAEDALIQHLVMFMAGRARVLKEMPTITTTAPAAMASVISSIANGAQPGTWHVLDKR